MSDVHAVGVMLLRDLVENGHTDEHADGHRHTVSGADALVLALRALALELVRDGRRAIGWNVDGEVAVGQRNFTRQN